MVRKWSYLNQKNLERYAVLNPIVKVKNFRVFKKTTKFKKFTKGLTKVVRRKYAKRIFFSTYLILLQITKLWAANFIQTKQLSRFAQSFGYSFATSYIPNSDIFSDFNRPSDKALNFQFLSCSKTLLYRTLNRKSIFLKNSTNKPFFSKSSTKNAKMSLAQTTSLTSVSENSEIIYTQNLCYDNLLYHPTLTDPAKLNQLLCNSITHTLFYQNLKITTVLYKILINTILLKKLPKTLNNESCRL